MNEAETRAMAAISENFNPKKQATVIPSRCICRQIWPHKSRD